MQAIASGSEPLIQIDRLTRAQKVAIEPCRCDTGAERNGVYRVERTAEEGRAVIVTGDHMPRAHRNDDLGGLGGGHGRCPADRDQRQVGLGNGVPGAGDGNSVAENHQTATLHDDLENHLAMAEPTSGARPDGQAQWSQAQLERAMSAGIPRHTQARRINSLARSDRMETWQGSGEGKPAVARAQHC